MSAKHTPGSWEIELIPDYQGSKVLIGANISAVSCGTLIAEIRGAIQIDGIDHPENLANARLIAAAPEMLEEIYEALRLRILTLRSSGLGYSEIDKDGTIVRWRALVAKSDASDERAAPSKAGGA